METLLTSSTLHIGLGQLKTTMNINYTSSIFVIINFLVCREYVNLDQLT